MTRAVRKHAGVVMAAATSAIGAGAAQGAIYTHTLSADALPSAQGYQYVAIDSPMTESQVFTVSGGGVLHMSTMGNGYQMQGANAAYMGVSAGEYDPGLDVVLEARVRVIDGERLSYHYGFSLGVWFDGMYAQVGIMPGTLQNGTLSQVIARNNAQWTNWKLETDRANDVYRVYADGSLLFTDAILAAVGSPGMGLPNHTFWCGDGTGGANAEAELSSLSFRQIAGPVPAPGAGLGAAMAVGLLAWRRRRAGRMASVSTARGRGSCRGRA